jgi:hypothetical protein
MDLLELVKENSNSHFFLDEVDISKEQISPEILAEISKELSSDSYFWVACKSDKPPYKENRHLQGIISTVVLINMFNQELI